MPRLVVNPGHQFVIYGRQMQAGDEFECPEHEAHVWRLKGWARDAAPPQPRRGRYARADMRADDGDR